MTIEAEEIQRKVSASVRDMLDAFRIQAAAGPRDRQGSRRDHLPGSAWRNGEPRALPARAAGSDATKRGADAVDDIP